VNGNWQLGILGGNGNYVGKKPVNWNGSVGIGMKGNGNLEPIPANL